MVDIRQYPVKSVTVRPRRSAAGPKKEKPEVDQFKESFQPVARRRQARPGSTMVVGTLPGNDLIAVILPR
jgi:hypothetical protein